MRSIQRYFPGMMLIILICIALQSCDKGFVELNTNPNASGNANPQFTFTKAQLDGTANAMALLQGTMQYTTSFNDVAGFGAKYVLSQSNQTYLAFINGYPKEINEITDVIREVAADPEQVNLLSAARVWRVYCFSRLTDLYGDIPYSEAGKGYTDNLYKPRYDTQESIYADMLKELDEAAAGFDNGNANTFGAADLIYGGNVNQWRKFAYSLMLRCAMRMTRVNPGLAEKWARKAITGGVIFLNADIAKTGGYLSFGQDINKNPLALNLLNSDYIVSASSVPGFSNPEGGKFQDVFINELKANKDPRLNVLSVVYINGRADTTAALQKGMPASLGAKPADFISYSEPSQATLLRLNSPYLLITNAETNFLLAEAALRGWYTGNTAGMLYENGIRASMQQWVLFGSAGIIPENRISSYISEHRLREGSLEEQLKQIYTQFWIGVYPNAQEVFATYRRTGYPTLIPNNYVGNATGGKIFRRMLYPLIEQNLNGENYQAAVARQGPDDLLTRMWWDKP